MDYLKITLIFIISFVIYIFKMLKLDNGLLRRDHENKKRINLGTLYKGFTGPLKTLFLVCRYNFSVKNILVIIKELFFTFNNPLFIILFVSFFISQI
jgi:hypothetical protein